MILLLLNYKEICSLAQSSKLPELLISPLGIFLSYKFSITFLLEVFQLTKPQCVYGLLLQLNLQDSRSALLFSNSFSFAANFAVPFSDKLEKKLGIGCNVSHSSWLLFQQGQLWNRTASGHDWDHPLPFYLQCLGHFFEFKSLS